MSCLGSCFLNKKCETRFDSAIQLFSTVTFFTLDNSLPNVSGVYILQMSHLLLNNLFRFFQLNSVVISNFPPVFNTLINCVIPS